MFFVSGSVFHGCLFFFYRKALDQMSIEREKLLHNVADANTRASLLAQEVDDYHIKLEESSQNKIMCVMIRMFYVFKSHWSHN